MALEFKSSVLGLYETKEMDRLKEPPCHLIRFGSGPFTDRAKYFLFESTIL